MVKFSAVLSVVTLVLATLLIAAPAEAKTERAHSKNTAPCKTSRIDTTWNIRRDPCKHTASDAPWSLSR